MCTVVFMRMELAPCKHLSGSLPPTSGSACVLLSFGFQYVAVGTVSKGIVKNKKGPSMGSHETHHTREDLCLAPRFWLWFPSLVTAAVVIRAAHLKFLNKKINVEELCCHVTHHLTLVTQLASLTNNDVAHQGGWSDLSDHQPLCSRWGSKRSSSRNAPRLILTTLTNQAAAD